MKNVRLFYHPDDIHQHFYRKWHTDLFRQEHQKAGSFIHSIMERLAKYPLFTYDLSDHPQADLPVYLKTEWKHMSPWWGGFYNYSIDSPLNDTFWLHEFAHRVLMHYLPNISLSGFQQKMKHNELRATMMSMFEIYFHYPQFRELTYPVEILADRFLENKQFMDAWKYDPLAKSEQLFLMLREATFHPNPTDPLEHFFYEYNLKDKKWLQIWSKSFNIIESRMDKFQRNIQCGADRKIAMDEFMEWLQSEDITQGTEMPFPDEAIAWAAIYQSE